jgi:hypothetical protein
VGICVVVELYGEVNMLTAVKVKFALEQAVKAQRVSRSIALLLP